MQDARSNLNSEAVKKKKKLRPFLKCIDYKRCIYQKGNGKDGRKKLRKRKKGKNKVAKTKNAKVKRD